MKLPKRRIPVEQSLNSRTVPRVGQSRPNARSKRADGDTGVRVTQVERIVRARVRDERAIPRVSKVAAANPSRQI